MKAINLRRPHLLKRLEMLAIRRSAKERRTIRVATLADELLTAQLDALDQAKKTKGVK